MTLWETIRLEYRGADDLPGLVLAYGLFTESGERREYHELRPGDEPLRLRTLNPDLVGGCWKSWCPLPDYMTVRSLPQPEAWLEWLDVARRVAESRERGEVPAG